MDSCTSLRPQPQLVAQLADLAPKLRNLALLIVQLREPGEDVVPLEHHCGVFGLQLPGLQFRKRLQHAARYGSRSGRLVRTPARFPTDRAMGVAQPVTPHDLRGASRAMRLYRASSRHRTGGLPLS